MREDVLLAQDLIKKHSEFISYPISLWTEKTTEKEVDDDDEAEESSAPKEEDEEGKIEEVLLSRAISFLLLAITQAFNGLLAVAWPLQAHILGDSQRGQKPTIRMMLLSPVGFDACST